MIRHVIVAAVIALGLTYWPAGVLAESCGLKPLRPVPPVGCKDLAASCQCDSKGKNCHWVWTCVK